jgi:hypothetical protein
LFNIGCDSVNDNYFGGAVTLVLNVANSNGGFNNTVDAGSTVTYIVIVE